MWVISALERFLKTTLVHLAKHQGRSSVHGYLTQLAQPCLDDLAMPIDTPANLEMLRQFLPGQIVVKGAPTDTQDGHHVFGCEQVFDQVHFSPFL